jgi:DNA primase
MMIKPEVIERIRQETDIVELIGAYLPLKKVGRNYRGLCPFHSERSPSFYVSPERQSYHCFGCGAGGTAISFIMQYEKLDFPDAVRFLARRLGIRVEEETKSGRNQLLYEACERAARFFEQMLVKSEQAQNYLKKRGLSQETVKRFRLGFAPGGNTLRGTMGRLGLNEEALVAAGLLIKTENGLVDYFRERIMFPIFSLSGKVVGFGGRVLETGEPKYLNSPDTRIFRKGEILYGIFQAKAYIREKLPILVEGNFDLLSLVDKGINNCIASLGTALTQEQALLLRRYNHRVVLCYDGDEAGQKACRRSLVTLLGAGIDPQIVVLPPGDDPDSYVRKVGKDGFLDRLSAGGDFVQFITTSARMEKVAEQRAVVRELSELVHFIPDNVTRELYANRIAQMFGISPNQILVSGSSQSPEPRATNQELRTSRDKSGLAEKLAAAAVQDRKLARIAREFSLSEMVDDETIKKIARLAEELHHLDWYGPALIMDSLDDEEARRRIARWLFAEQVLPSEQEYRDHLCRFRARWLQRQIELAHSKGDGNWAEVLSREKDRLLKLKSNVYNN